MKILIINYRYFVSGGPERYMFDLIDMLEQHAHEVIPFSIQSSRNKPTVYEPYFASPLGGQDEAYFDNMKKTPKMFIEVISRLFYSFHVKRKLEKLIKDTKPDVAYILHHYNKLSPSVIDACKKYNLKVIVRLSDYFLICPQAHMLNCHKNICEACISDGYINCIKNRCIKGSFIGSLLKTSAIYFHRHILKIYDKVDRFVCTNEFMKEKMEESGYPSDKICVLPTFKNRADLKLSAYNKERFILYFGRFAFEKAVDTLIRAYLKSNLHKKGIRLFIIGGKIEEVSLNLTKKEQETLAHNCRFFEFMEKNELNSYIIGSLFVVHPSRWYENMPNTILEALSFNKPVITARIGSLPFLVNDTIGALYEYEDHDDLASKMNIMVDPLQREKREKNIPSYFKQFDKELHYNRLLKIIGEHHAK